MLPSRVMTESLALCGVSKSYHAGVRGCSATIAVLRDVDLTVSAGEIVTVSALPGAGKTTLMMCAAGLIRPDRGYVSWFGGPLQRDVASKPDGIAYASDRPFPYGFLTVREALEYGAIARDLPFRDSGRIVSCALDRARLGVAADRRVDSLTRSDLARMSIASALLSSPGLLLVDDVGSGCDATTAIELIALVRGLASSGTAVVMTGPLVSWLSSGPPSLACSRAVALIAGRIRPAVDASRSGVRAAVPHARVAEPPPNRAAMGKPGTLD